MALTRVSGRVVYPHGEDTPTPVTGDGVIEYVHATPGVIGAAVHGPDRHRTEYVDGVAGEAWLKAGMWRAYVYPSEGRSYTLHLGIPEDGDVTLADVVGEVVPDGIVTKGDPGEPGEPGRDGQDGQDGHTPEITFDGTTIVVDGVPGPDLKGDPGEGGGGIAGAVPIFATLAEAEAWEAANPGRKALTVEPPETDVDPPTPGTLTVSPTDITANLTVTGASDNRAITGYAFRRGTGTWSDWQVGNTYTATGLTPGTEYTFQHKVRDGAGNEALGAPVTRTTAAMSAKTPQQIGALWEHWDASAAGKLTTSGTAVSAWAGTTSTERTLAQATAAQQPVTTTMGGLTAVQFDRTAKDFMRYQGTFAIDATVGYTVCWIGRFDDATISVNQAVMGLAGGATIVRRTPDGLLQSAQNPSLDGPVSLKPTTAGQVVMLALVVRNNAASFAWISGVAGATKAIMAGSPSTALDLGKNPANPPESGDYASATVGEAWVHERALSTAELDSLHMYAQQKWGAA